MVVSDLNLAPEGIETVVAMCRRAGVPLCVDPTSPSHAPKICGYLDQLFLVTPNASETYALCGMEDPIGGHESAVNAAKRLVASGVQMVIITLGEHGLAYADHAHAGHIEARKTSIVDATGAGDAMSAAVIFGLLNGIEIDEAIRLGKTAAMLTLRSRESVVAELTPDLLYEHLVI
jgi:pseudouridine kinase